MLLNDSLGVSEFYDGAFLEKSGVRPPVLVAEPQLKPVQALYLAGEDDPAANTVPGATSRPATFVGKGINVLTASGPTFANLKSQLLSEEALAQQACEVEDSPFSHSESRASEKFVDLFTSDEFSASVGTGEKLVFFSANLSTRFGSSEKITGNIIFYNAMAQIIMETHTLAAKYTGPNLGAAIHKSIQPILEKAAPEDIFSWYGTHIVSKASAGGCIHIDGSFVSDSKVTTREFQVAANVACSYAKANSEYKMTQEEERVAKNTIITATAYGGNEHIIVDLHRLEDIYAKIAEWGASIVKTRKLSLAQIHSYQPIWDAVSSETQKKALKEAFFKSARERFNIVANYFKIDPIGKEPVLVFPQAMMTSLRGNFAKGGFVSRPQATGHFKGVVSVDSPAHAKILGLYRMYTHDDDTVSFRHSLTDMFVSVRPYSSSKACNFGDMQQLYADGEGIEIRQKFIMEKGTVGHRLKSCLTGKYVRVVALEGAMFLFADAEQKAALEFEFVTV